MTFFLALLALLLALCAFVVIIPTVLHMNRLGEAVHDLAETVSDISRDMTKVPAPRKPDPVDVSLSTVERTAELATIGGRRDARSRAVAWHPPRDNVGSHWDTIPEGLKAVLAFNADEWSVVWGASIPRITLRHQPCGEHFWVVGAYTLSNIIDCAKGHLPCPGNG